MKTTKTTMGKRLLSFALAAAMLCGMVPLSAFAQDDGIQATGAVITAFGQIGHPFEQIAEGVYGQKIELGTTLEALGLPKALTVSVQMPTVTEPEKTEPEKTEPEKTEPEKTEPEKTEPEKTEPEKTEPEQGTVDLTDSEPEVPLSELPENTIPTQEITLPVQWESGRTYTTEEQDTFVFHPVFAEGYAIAEGVKVPEIQVVVGGVDGTCTCISVCSQDSTPECAVCQDNLANCTGEELLFTAPDGTYLPRVPVGSRLRSGGGPIVTQEVDFDIFLNIDGSYSQDPATFSAKVKAYLDTLIANDGQSYTSRINATSASIDPTDLTKWYVYDHYDSKWYTNQADWTTNYMQDTTGNSADIPKAWFYYPVSDTKAGGKNKDFMGHGTAGKMTIADIQAGNPGTASWGNTAFLREHIGTGKDSAGAPFMQFYGYYKSENADFLFYPASASSTKKVVFDVDASKVLPHSLDSAGFLINTGVDDKGTPDTADDIINGYVMLITYKASSNAADEVASVTLYQLKNANINTLHNKGMNGLTSANKILKETSAFRQSKGNMWLYSRIALDITATSLKASIQQLDSSGNLQGSSASSLFDVSLEDTAAGGFGPFVDMAVTTGHSCDTTSSYRFSNLQMSFAETMKGDADLEALQYADYLEKGKQKYFINLIGTANEYGRYNKTDANRDPNGIDTAYLNKMKDEKIILLTDKSGAGATEIYPETYLGDNKKDYNNTTDMTGSDADIAALNPTTPEDTMAAKLAWLIYHNQKWDDENSGGGVVVPETVAKAELLLMDKASAGASPWDGASQVNEIRKELIGTAPLKVFLNPDNSKNVSGTYNGTDYTLIPSYTLTKPDGTTATLTGNIDATSGKIYFEVDKTWASGNYSVILNYAVGGPVTSVVPGTTKFSVSTDSVAPVVAKPSGVTTTADGKITATIGATNTPSTGENTYTSDLAYYAVVVNTTAAPAAANTIADKVAITAAIPMPTTFTNNTVSAAGGYYVHVYVWDAAGNSNVNTSDKLTITKLPQATDIGGNATDDGTLTGENGKKYYVLELGKDSDKNFPINVTSTSVPGGAKTYAIKTGNDKITLNTSNGRVTPSAVGKATVEVTIAGNGLYNDAKVLVTIVVVEPLTVGLDIVMPGAVDKVTVKPTEKDNLYYPIKDDTEKLEYREKGTENWTEVPSWNWGDNVDIAYADLKPGTTYEVKVSATDTHPTDPTTAEKTVELTTPKGTQDTTTDGNTTDNDGTVTGESGKKYYVLELGKDQDFSLNVTSTTAPDASVTYTTQPNDTVITLADGKVTPVALGKTKVTATVAGNTQYNEAVVEVTIVVVPPLSVNLAITGYDSTKVTVKPNNQIGLYPIDANQSTLQYHEVGSDTWVTIPGWNWGDAVEIPFADLKWNTSYEVKIAATDTRMPDPTTATDTITFKTPVKAGDNNGAGGSGDGTSDGKIDVGVIQVPKDKTVVISVEKGGDIVASVEEKGTADPTGRVDVTFDKLPDGIYNVVVKDENGNRRTEEVEIKNGVPTKSIEFDYDALATKETVLVFEKSKETAPTPSIVVGGLNEQYEGVTNTEAKKGVTTDDLLAINTMVNGKKGSALLELKVHGVAQTDVTAKDDITLVREAAKGQLIAQLFDLTLWKTITPAAQLVGTTTQLIESNELITVYTPMPNYSGFNLKLYRVHEDGAKTAGEIPKDKTNADGSTNEEYFEIIDGMIVLHVKKFSLYAFTYTPYSSDGGNSGSNVTYPVKPEKDPDGGDITTDKGSSNPGNDVTITVKPDDGYVLDDIVVKDKDGNEIPVKDKGNGEYTFTMPDSAVTITPTFREELASLDKTGVGKKLNAADHIRYLQGDDLGTFRPLADMTRAEVAQMFYNLLLDKSIAQTVTFSDVNAEAWYAKAVHTLASMGIVEGYAGAYRPMDPITRAEFTAIAVRFANEQTGRVKFSDVPESHWAYKAIGTAAYYGWIKGSDGKFSPNLNISRAEVSAIVNRMLVRIADKAYITGNLNTLKIFPDAADQNYWAWLDIVESTNAHDFKKDGKEVWTGLQ